MTDLSGLFSPSRVAVIGATEREDSVGRALVENLRRFDGEVVPVNPNRDEVFGRVCYPSIGDVPDAGGIDLAVIVVPAPAVVEVVREAGHAGIENVVVVSAGFSESGEEGTRRERELTAVARKHGLNLVGPNCVGVISASTGLNATFLEGNPSEGSISLMSQSGAFISAVLDWAAQQGIGFKNVVSLGNEALLDEIDFVSEWSDDPDTDVILAYLEDIDEGHQFVKTARHATAETPLVVIKSGRTEAGAEAAASHTGSIAGSDEAYQAAFEQAGVIRADGIREAFDMGQALAGQPLPETDGVAVVTNGGGPGVLAADAIGDSDSRLRLAGFSDGLRADLTDMLPEQADVGNPLDIIGDAPSERFSQSLDAVMAEEDVGSVVVLSVPTALFEFEELAEVIADRRSDHDIPVAACLMGGAQADSGAARLREHGIPNYFDPARAVRSLDALAEYREIRRREYEEPTEFDVDRERARETLSQAIDRDVDYLGVEVIDLLDAYGIPTPRGELVESPVEAEAVAADLGGPVVMKIVSPDIVHKSDVGGVEVGVEVDRAGATFRTLRDRALEHDPDAEILGVQVEELVGAEDSTETIVGVNRDPQFGHLLMFGLGGIYVEIFEDTAFRVAPVSEHEARAMTAAIRASPILRGARGREPADLDAVVETIQRISQLVTDFPAITELDVNPLVASPDGVTAIDIRLTVDHEDLDIERADGPRR